MKSEENVYRQPMQPWPDLKPFGKEVTLSDHNLTLFYYEAGNAKDSDILMIHGLGDEADTWRYMIKPLAENFHIIALDLPGFGRSDKPNLKYSPNFMMGSILELMDQLEIEKALIMGSSLGAMLAQGLAIANGERVSGLILIDGALLQHELMQDWGLRLMQAPLLGEWLYTRLRKDPLAAFDSLRHVYHDLDALPKVDREFLYERVTKRVWSNGQRRAYFSTLRNLMPWVRDAQSELPGKLASLDIPTLVIRGEHDVLFPKENADEIIQCQPNAKQVTIKGVKHLPQQEDPENTLEEVQNWLGRYY